MIATEHFTGPLDGRALLGTLYGKTIDRAMLDRDNGGNMRLVLHFIDLTVLVVTEQSQVGWFHVEVRKTMP